MENFNGSLVDIEGRRHVFTVAELSNRRELIRYGRFLIADWCDCKRSDFLCYAEDNACPCGVKKHHTHCKNCGGISQVG